MVVVMLLTKGKTWITEKPNAKCPYDIGTELKMIYDYTHYSGAFTEVPAHYLPATLKRANPESIAVYECPTCQKRFISWESPDLEFHEAKIFPDESYVEIKENEVGLPTMPQSNQMQGVNSSTAKDCDCNGECDNDKCGNNKMNPNKADNRPSFYR